MNENVDDRTNQEIKKDVYEKIRIKLHFDLKAEPTITNNSDTDDSADSDTAKSSRVPKSHAESGSSRNSDSLRQKRPHDIFYRIKSLSESSDTVLISEAKFVKGVVTFIDKNLGEYLEEDLYVEHLITMHGSLELILVISTTASLVGSVLGSTSSLISSVNTVAEAIEDLSREWMWREDMNASSASATPVSRRRVATAPSASAAPIPSVSSQFVERRSAFVMVVVAAVLSSVITSFIIYSLLSEDMALNKAEIQSLGRNIDLLEGRIGSMQN